MVEAETSSQKKLYAETVPFVANSPEERVTLSFLEKLMAKFGFYKEKAEKFKEQQEMDRKMEACKQRVKEKMGKPLTKEEEKAGKQSVIFSAPMTNEKKERLKITREIAKENCKAVIFGITNTANTASIYSFVEASWLAAKGKDVIVYCNIEEFEDGPVKKSIKNSLGFFVSKGVKIVQTINELAKEVINKTLNKNKMFVFKKIFDKYEQTGTPFTGKENITTKVVIEVTDCEVPQLTKVFDTRIAGRISSRMKVFKNLLKSIKNEVLKEASISEYPRLVVKFINDKGYIVDKKEYRIESK
jgi:hypothetical protein